MKWRVVITDSENATGVAPVCDGPSHIRPLVSYAVHDCCPGPHLECGTGRRALILAALLNEIEVEPCS